MSDARSLHQQILKVTCHYRSIKHELAVLLARMADGHFAELGYSSVAAYAYNELDLSGRQVRALVCLGRRLPEFPELQRAFAQGLLPWTKARELLRVVTPETEAEWVERAKQITNRQLENQIGVSLMGEGPPDDEPKGPQRRRVSYSMNAQEADLLRAAIAMVRQATGLNPDELDDGAILGLIAQRTLHDGQGRAGEAGDDAGVAGDTSAHPPSAERFRVVLGHCPRCRQTSGIHDHVDETHVGHSACDSEVQDGRPGPTRGHLARTIPPATRRAVLHRDRWRCAVPGCRNELWLDLHHVRERHLGGDHSEGNLLTLCGSHHRTVHAGLMAVEHSATGGVRFEFGDGRVLRRPHLGGATEPGPKRMGRQDQPGASGL